MSVISTELIPERREKISPKGFIYKILEGRRDFSDIEFTYPGDLSYHEDAYKRLNNYLKDKYNHYLKDNYESLRENGSSLAIENGISLAGSDLSGVGVPYIFLPFVWGCSVNLKGANLSNANLRYGRFLHADFRGANLGFADLRGADLSSAYLIGANLVNAKLNGADLRGAVLDNAILSLADLRGAENLEEARWIKAGFHHTTVTDNEA